MRILPFREKRTGGGVGAIGWTEVMHERAGEATNGSSGIRRPEGGVIVRTRQKGRSRPDWG